jgi:hypothetical protein
VVLTSSICLMAVDNSSAYAGTTTRIACPSGGWQICYSYSLRDACGGINGRLIFKHDTIGPINSYWGDSVQAYGLVWENDSAGCKGGRQYSYFSFTSLSGNYNGDLGSAGSNQVSGFNSDVVSRHPFGVGSVRATLCSSVGGWHCPDSVPFWWR